ncbi:MAG: hypothetical protein ACJARP_000556 [Vicingaceae bacterium]|jgi:hypothetical protein
MLGKYTDIHIKLLPTIDSNEERPDLNSTLRSGLSLFLKD